MGHKSGVTQTVNPENTSAQEHAQSKRSLYQRWRDVMADIESVEKRGKSKNNAGEIKYPYMKAADVLKELRPLFAKHGLILKSNPRVDNINDEEFETRNSGKAHFVRLEVNYVLINIDDPSEREELVGIADAADNSDKALHKARTGALKYTLRDNFMIDDQDDVAESETETPERAGPQNKVGQARTQSTAAPANAPPVVTREFIGSIAECGEGVSDEGPFKWFILHNRSDRMYSFRSEDFEWIQRNNRITMTGVEKLGRQQRPYWVVTKLSAPLITDLINNGPESTPTPKPIAVPESAATILKRMYPEPEDAKFKRLIEAPLEEQPESLRARIMQSFEKRVNSEHPSTGTGLLSCLDISIQAVTEEAAEGASELFPQERAQ